MTFWNKFGKKKKKKKKKIQDKKNKLYINIEFCMFELALIPNFSLN